MPTQRARRSGNMVYLEPQTPLRRRGMRSPGFDWNVYFRPFQIQPVMCAPVLAGDTMKSGYMSMRVLSDPIKNLLSGWWMEFYLFYVRIGDLDDHATIRAALADPTNASLSSLADASARSWTYYDGNGIDWLYQAMKPIVRSYFRDEGLDWDAYTIDSVPCAKAGGESWFRSLTPASNMTAESGSDDWEKLWSIFEQMRAQKLTNATWEEYLAQNGVSTPPKLIETEEDLRRPELLRYAKHFMFPTSTVDPDTGLRVGSLQWNMQERIDQGRFFAEPGFVVGCVVGRPKVQMGNQAGRADGFLLKDAAHWMPPALDQDPHASIVKLATDDNYPLGYATENLYLDGRDVFLYGDQFRRSATFVTDAMQGCLSGLPIESNLKWPTLSMVQAIFVGGGGSGSGDPAREFLKADGTCRLNIASRIAHSLIERVE